MHNMWGYILVVLIMVCHTANFLTAQQQRGYPTRVNFPAVETPQKPSKISDFDPLPTIKEDFMVNDLAGEGGADQYNSSVAMDSQGNFAVIWVDERNGREDLYIQFYDPQKNKKGPNILVDEEIDPHNPEPVIICNKKGQFVISWLKTHAEPFAIIFNADGSARTEKIKLNSLENSSVKNLYVSARENGGFLATWVTRNKYSGINYLCSRTFSEDGIPFADEVLIKQTTINISFSFSRSAAIDGNGNYLVVWAEIYDSQKHVFLQKINHDGLLVGSNVIVHNFSDDSHSINTSVCGSDDGNFLITWSSEGVSGKIFNWNNGFTTGPFEIFSDTFAIQRCSFVIDENAFLILINDGSGLHYRKISKEANLEEIKIIDEVNQPYLFGLSVEITNFSQNSFLITWDNNFRIDSDILISEININTGIQTEIIKPNDDIYSSQQNKPRLHINNQGKVLAVWVDERNQMQELYAQLYDRNYNRIGNNIRISDSEETSYNEISDFVTGSFSDGSFLIAYIDRSDNCCFQKLSPYGELEGDLKIVSTEEPGRKLEMKINEGDEILLCIISSFHDMDYVEIHHYNKWLNLVSPVSKCLEENNDITRRPFAISINEDFDVFLSWGNRTDNISGDMTNLYGIIFNSKGEIVSDTLLIAEGESSYYFNYMANKIDLNGNVSVAWSFNEEYEEKYSVKNFFFESDTMIIKEHKFSPVPIFNFQPDIIEFRDNKSLITWSSGSHTFVQTINENIKQNKTYLVGEKEIKPGYWWGIFPTSSIIYNNKYYFAHSGFTNPGTGGDIYLGIKELEFDAFGPDHLVSTEKGDYLYNNYPNPFNDQTKINFRILTWHQVKITIYDILGREVSVLINREMEPGYYSVLFDASTLASGVYFCRLEAFDTKVIKMLHLK